jgi:uncharacterized membrane protein
MSIADTTIPTKVRVSSIDLMRGLLMVIMALDHVRDYFHSTAFVFDRTYLTKTTLILFFTRWITHFCAPGFVFLSGISIYLSLQRKTKKELSVFLITRGLWLVLVEIVVMRFALLFNFYFDVTIFGIIGVIGVCMIFMAGLLHLRPMWILILHLSVDSNTRPYQHWVHSYFAETWTGYFVPCRSLASPYDVWILCRGTL